MIKPCSLTALEKNGVTNPTMHLEGVPGSHDSVKELQAFLQVNSDLDFNYSSTLEDKIYNVNKSHRFQPACVF